MQLAFGNCVLDLERRELYRDGALVHTRAKVFDILDYLVANPDRVLSRDDLMAHGWPGLTVSDATLSSCMLSVRRAIGDDSSDPRFIKTLRGQGFRFIAEVTLHDGSSNISTSSAGPGNGQSKRSASPPHARDDRLSIAVLPFVNLNKDPKLDYLANGLAEDVTRALSRFKALTVIAHSSSSQYSGPDDDIQKIGAELRVDYVLEGSVRCDKEVLRATVQLIQTSTAQHIWAENYDGQIKQLLALQDSITQQIATSIKPEIDLAEIRRASGSPAGELPAQEMAWRARALMDKGRLEATPSLYEQGMALAERAAALDPQCRQAWWTICLANFLVAFAPKVDPAVQLARAREAAEKLRVLDRNDHSAYMALGWISYLERDFERAQTNLNHAYALNPNCTMTLMHLSVVLISLGRADAGYEHLRRAIRLSPRDLWLGFMLAALSFACYALEMYEDGIKFIEQAIEREPQAPANHVLLAICLVELGDLDGAGAAIHSQRRISEGYFRQYLDGKRMLSKDPKLAARFLASLRHAAEAAGD